MGIFDQISVIVPVYKVEAYLDRCVQSVLNQTYKNLEIILVDDGSPDNCPAMCDAWAKRDPRIRVIHKQNGGLSDARNAGMAVAAGEFISFIDSDDWIASEMLERLVQAIERDDSDIAACAVEMVWEDGRPRELLTVRENCVLERGEAQMALLKETLLKQPVWYKLYRKNTICGIPFEVGKVHEDVFWSYQAIGNARRVSLVDYIGYYYSQRPGSIMGEGYSLKRLDALEAQKRRCAYVKERFPELLNEAVWTLRSSCVYHGQMALKYLPKNEQKQAFAALQSILDSCALSTQAWPEKKLSHRVWLKLAEVSLKGTCRLKNLLSVGL